MGRAKKTVTKKTTAKRKVATKKSAVKTSESSSPSGESSTTAPQGDGTKPDAEEETVIPARGEDVVVLETSEGSIGFNTRDKLQGRLVEMNLKRGKNRVPVALFEAFEDDDFFVEHILGKGVVKVISRPGKSLGSVDI